MSLYAVVVKIHGVSNEGCHHIDLALLLFFHSCCIAQTPLVALKDGLEAMCGEII